MSSDFPQPPPDPHPSSQANPYQTDGSQAHYGPMTGQPQTVGGDATGGVIPYKNPQALIAYYLAVFSLIPCLGLPLGLGAVVLGILGLRARSRQPQIKGSAHAWIGIIGGGLMFLLNLGAIVLSIVIPLLAK